MGDIYSVSILGRGFFEKGEGGETRSGNWDVARQPTVELFIYVHVVY